MPVNLAAPRALAPVAGVRLATASLGLRKEPRDDLALFAFDEDTTLAATFTRNALKAAPVVVAREHLSAATPRALIVNAGNANAGTGGAGIEAARRCCQRAAAALGVDAEQVLPFSTGVIGEPLDVEAVGRAIDAASSRLAEDAWLAAARAIVTTDIVPKGRTRRVDVSGAPVTVTGIAKGSGMIHPDMATMLAFVATDARVERDCLSSLLVDAVNRSFNCITVDGDTSTNDACVLAATGRAGNASIAGPESPGYGALAAAIDDVLIGLAQAIVRDGEGATKFVTVEVCAGRDVDECRRTAFTVAHSPLVKTALFASDANWGRILAAVGRAEVTGLDIEQVAIWLDDVQIVAGGARAADYTEARGAEVMARDEIAIRIALGRGDAVATVWTCDFSHEYVSINADYRS